MAEEEIMMDDTTIAIDDVAEEGGQDETKSYNIIPFIMDRYKKADDYREQDEQRWLRAYRNYRGLYGSDVQFTEAEKSRVFIKVTKTKTLAAYGQIVDVLFANNKFPLTVEPTTLPEGVVSDVSFDPKEPESIRSRLDEMESPYGFSGDGQDLPAGSTQKTLMEKLGPLQGKFDDVDNLREGVGKTPTAVTFVDADNLEIGQGGLYAGDANLQVGGKLSQVADGEIQVTSLTVTSAADLDLTTAVNAVDVLSVASSGFDVDFRNNADLEISSSGLTANDVSITLAGDLTQDLTGTIDVNELQVLGNRGKIDLTSTTNEIDKVGASGSASTASNNQRVTGISFTGGTGYGVNETWIPVTFGDSPTGDTATGYITADASGEITPDSLTITNPGSGYKTAPAVTIADPSSGSAPLATSEIAFHDIAINNSVATIIDGLEANFGAITISSTGAVTQSGQIIAKSLSVTSDVGIQLDTSTNNVNEFSATSDTDNVTYYDAGDVEVGSIKGVNIELNTLGSLTQTPSGSIEGTTLSITGSRDVTLTSTANDVDTIQASGIYLANADGFGLDYTDVDDLIVDGVEAIAGSISITSGGTQTISNRVVAGAATGPVQCLDHCRPPEC